MYTLTQRRYADPGAFLMSDWDEIFDIVTGRSKTNYCFSIPKVRRLPNEGDTVSYEIDLPGIAPEDLKLKVEDRKLLLDCAKDKYSLRIPADVDPEGIKAKLKYGVLTLTLPNKKSSSVEISVDSD